MTSITVAFQTDKPLTAYGTLAATVEKYGFDGVTVYNDMLYQPAWPALWEMARYTNRVRLGPTAVNPFTCHPINIAGHIALLEEAAPERVYLGLARGAWLTFVGLQPAQPVLAMREAFDCVRHLLSQSTEPLPGSYFSLSGGDRLRWTIDRPNIPFLLGSWGPKTIRACARYIDEVKLGGTANPDVIPWLRGVVDEACDAATRPTDIGLVVGAVTVVDEDGKAARQLARRQVALYLPVVADLDPTLRLEPERLQGLREAAAAYDFDRAATYISDELLQRFAFAGTPEKVAEQAVALFAAGANRVEFGTPHGLTTESGLRLLGQQVLPALRMGGARESG